MTLPRTPSSPRRTPVAQHRARRSVARPTSIGPFLVTLAALALAVAATTPDARPVAALELLGCDAPVIDRAGVVDRDLVEAAAAGVGVGSIGPDAMVVVRVWGQVPEGDLGAAVDELVVECYGDPEGGIAPDVAILAIAVDDRAVDVLLGARWARVVDGDRLRTEVLSPGLAEGDYTGALVAALDDLGATVAGRAPAGSDEPITGSTGEATIDSEAVDGGTAGLDDGTSPVAVGLGVAGLGACAGAVVLVQRRRRLDQARQRVARILAPVQGRARIVRERHDRLMEAADVWYRTTAGRTRTVVGAEVRQAGTGREATDRASGLLHHALPGGAGDADRRELERGRELINELSRSLAAHGDVLDRLAALGAHLDHLRVALPAKAELLAREIPDVRAAIGARAADGWEVGGAEAELLRIQAVVEEVRTAASALEVDLLDLSERIEEAEARLFATDHDIETLPDRGPALTRWSDRLGEAADQELVRVDELRRQLAAASRVHAPESWLPVADHPERAVESIDRADDLRRQAVDELVAAQRFDEAGKALELAGLEMIAADGLLDQADDLMVDLDRAMAEAPGVLADSRRAIGALAAVIHRYGADVDGAVTRRHQELTAVMAALESELARPKPHHLRVVGTAEELGREVDRLVGLAEEQHLAAEALRRELHREVARAWRALSRARRSLGWQLAPSGDAAAIDRLEADLRSLPDDPAAAIEDAADIADSALRIQEQIIARRRRRGVAVTVGSAPPVIGRGGWTIGGSIPTGSPVPDGRSSGGAPVGPRSRGGRSFGGRSPAGGGRSIGSRRSSGRF